MAFPNKFPKINQELLSQLRGLFFSKDNPVLLAKNQFIGLTTQNTPSSNPPSPYIFVYPKADGNFYKLDSVGNEVLIGSAIDTFLQLLDTPNSYASKSNNYVKVNNAATALQFVTGGIELIGEIILGGSAASVTFDLTNYQQFRHLLLFFNARTDRVNTADAVTVRFNGDSGGNYDTDFILGNNSLALSTTTTAQTAASLGQISGATATADNFGGGFCLFNNYTNTNIRKTYVGVSINLADQTAANIQLIIRGGHRRNTAATTSITLLPGVGPNFIANSIFALYGVY